MWPSVKSSANSHVMRGAKPEASIEQSIERDGVIRARDRVAIACSGGADSVALVHALASLRKPMELELTLAHVNHGTRESAWQDECVVLRIGATFGLAVRVAALDGDRHDEAALRQARYAALAEMALAAGANVVATAHHQEDQSETVLLALLRGAGPDGLAGMRARRPLVPGVDLARPLLGIAADDLRGLCHVHALPYAVDPTNADRGLRRNALRAALEALRPLFPGLDARGRSHGRGTGARVGRNAARRSAARGARGARRARRPARCRFRARRSCGSRNRARRFGPLSYEERRRVADRAWGDRACG